jgi:hypothetical protein
LVLERERAGWNEITPHEKLEGWTRLPVPATGTLGRARWHLGFEGEGGKIEFRNLRIKAL